MSKEAAEALTKSVATRHYFKEDDGSRPIFDDLKNGEVEFVPGTQGRMVVGRTDYGILFHARLDEDQ